MLTSTDLGGIELQTLDYLDLSPAWVLRTTRMTLRLSNSIRISPSVRHKGTKALGC